MSRYRYLALPAYFVAAALVLIPLVDAALSLWPWRPGAAQWRFGAIGLASNALMIPAAGLLIMLATSLTLGHWRTLRVFGAVCALAALCTFVSIFLFGLDAIQTRVNVNPNAHLSFTVASFTAAAKLLLATITLIGCAIAGLRTKAERVRPTPKGSQTPLVNV
ncbi:MAG TPA: hypothetical protein VFO52_09095 [Longimicrobiales bacterium]|nr:hypothetical protein [Longimicrobiales bacterium]